MSLKGDLMIDEMGKKARAASRKLALTTTAARNDALTRIGEQIWRQREKILSANQEDVESGSRAGLTPALLDRLLLNEKRLASVCADLNSVVDLPDPVGEIFDTATLPNGLQIHKQRVPLGVLGVIYEARPNVTVDVTGLGLKSGNALILRGGSETLASNLALVTVIQRALEGTGLPQDCVQIIADPDRRRVGEMLALQEYIDMIIPRGGVGLHKFCRENSRIPVITGGIGICHLFVDDNADLPRSLEVIRNAKIQRPSVCNALDTALIHRGAASAFIPELVSCLERDGVSFRIDPSAAAYLPDLLPPSCLPASPEDFDTEWLSLVLGIKVVENLDEAIEHIAAHSTAHSDGILTASVENAARFLAEVDSAAVYVNASTRFTDGAQLGLGAEVAVSTQRLHARGPMGLRELTSYKWVIQGDYHVRP
ncbi:MAG TPA: glutamate-5-semialdehyde dehydrogenase [Anaerolineaceae bacterium]|nr:glutamate-5-semialdehyde dehydrogenase [Anaerolineaceae bacterium]